MKHASNPLAGMGAVNYDATIMPRGVIVPTSITIQQMTSAGVAVRTSPYELLLVTYSKYQYPFL